MKVYNKLITIRDELDSWTKDAFKEGVVIKLNRSESNYRKRIEENFDYILSRSNYKAFKALSKYESRRKD